ncbi:MAG: hypothetical protein JHC33_12975 [Ignisphaera sp.]|nr:hypothetical protein [Ignisphaera sp.]
MAKSLVSLKEEATELNIAFDENIKALELQKLIDSHYDSVVKEEIKDEENFKDSYEKDKANLPQTMRRLAKSAEAEARKTKVIIVTDNDSRVNNVTTTARVACANQYFDLGDMDIPLNEPVEVFVGHLNSLRERVIPAHVSDRNTGSATHMRARYNIQIIKE